VLLSLQLVSQKQKFYAAFPSGGKPESAIVCCFPFSWRSRSRNIVLLFLSWEPEAEISCYFFFIWRARSRNFELLSLQLENQKQKYCAAFSWVGEPEAESRATLGGEPEAEIMSYFSFTWAKSRNLVLLLTLQLESQKQKSRATFLIAGEPKSRVLLSLQLEIEKQKFRAEFPSVGEPEAEISWYPSFRILKFCGNKEQIKCARNLELH
jgi:hypothetical protein